jgi:transcriptional regulator with GAF, ATPase, and Fis domain
VINVDVRVLAATNKDLARAVPLGTFREDLFFRLDVFPIRVPALRERKFDVAILAEAFVFGFCKENGLRSKKIDPSVFDALSRRKWPGNVRELKNVVERAAILSSDVITIADLPEDPHESPFDDEAEEAPLGSNESPTDAEATLLPRAPSDRLTLRDYREATERAYIVDTLKALEWNISKAAIVLGVERTNLHKKVRAYGIKRGEG